MASYFLEFALEQNYPEALLVANQFHPLPSEFGHCEARPLLENTNRLGVISFNS